MKRHVISRIILGLTAAAILLPALVLLVWSLAGCWVCFFWGLFVARFFFFYHPVGVFFGQSSAPPPPFSPPGRRLSTPSPARAWSASAAFCPC